jgi:heterodisulfide reductase subunit C
MSGHSIYKENSIAGELQQELHISVAKCYQCGKCSAGCPVNSEMDFPPSVVIRMLQTGDPRHEEKLLRSYSIWMCVTCEMCYGRCPMEIDIPKVMDFLRQKSLELGIVNPKAKNIVKFHKAFLDSVSATGRLSEFGLILDYKMRTLSMTQDVGLAPKMIARGKLHFIPERIKDMSMIKKIFNKTIKKETNQ